MRTQHAGVLRGLDLIETTVGRTLERLQAGLAERLPHRLEAAPPLLRAAVLIPLFVVAARVEVLFTRRTDTVLTHKGQISFPGGQREATDASMVETALRESYEEIGLEVARVTVLGELDDVFTSVSGFIVTPVVGMVEGPPADLTLAPAEVKSVFTVPIDRLQAVHTTQVRQFDGHAYRIHYYTVADDVIWGATGLILHQFLASWERAAV
ncbi:MAG: CoA pyrophosphatase [Candidatus Dormibacter sp.]